MRTDWGPQLSRSPPDNEPSTFSAPVTETGAASDPSGPLAPKVLDDLSTAHARWDAEWKRQHEGRLPDRQSGAGRADAPAPQVGGFQSSTPRRMRPHQHRGGHTQSLHEPLDHHDRDALDPCPRRRSSSGARSVSPSRSRFGPDPHRSSAYAGLMARGGGQRARRKPGSRSPARQGRRAMERRRTASHASTTVGCRRELCEVSDAAACSTAVDRYSE